MSYSESLTGRECRLARIALVYAKNMVQESPWEGISSGGYWMFSRVRMRYLVC